MMCKLSKFLYWLIPVKSFKSYLINKHFSACSQCQREIEEESRLKELLGIPEWAKKEQSLWPQIQQRISIPSVKAGRIGRRHKSFLWKKWRWAMAGFVLAVIIGLVFLIHQNFLIRTAEDSVLEIDNPRIIIKHAEIKGKKAKPYIYQTPYVSFIWFAETRNSGG